MILSWLMRRLPEAGSPQGLTSELGKQALSGGGEGEGSHQQV